MSTNTKSKTEKDTNPVDEGDDKGKQEYLISYRNGLWTAIRHKETGIWQFVSFFAGAIVVIAGILQNQDTFSSLGVIQISLLSIIITVVSFWGIVVILDANYWQSRNLWLISNIEQRFLKAGDIGRIIPKSYTTPSFRYSNVYAMHLHFLSIILSVVFIGTVSVILQNLSHIGTQEKIVIGLLGLLMGGLILYVFDKDNSWVRDFYKTREGSTGDREKFINYAEYNRYKSQTDSPITGWFLFLSLLFFVFMMKCANLILGGNLSIVFFNFLLCIVLLFMAIFIFFKLFANASLLPRCEQYINHEITEADLSLKTEFVVLKKVTTIFSFVIKIAAFMSLVAGAVVIFISFL